MSESQRPCQCEHVAHLDEHETTPNGNPGHRYGVEHAPRALTMVATPWGHFNVCPSCRQDCLAER